MIACERLLVPGLFSLQQLQVRVAVTCHRVPCFAALVDPVQQRAFHVLAVFQVCFIVQGQAEGANCNMCHLAGFLQGPQLNPQTTERCMTRSNLPQLCAFRVIPCRPCIRP